jgi:chromosome partitioning protein
MPAYVPLEQFLQAANLKLLARLIDSDVYLRAAESGLGIFELDANLSVSERKQFTPLVEWVENRRSPAVASDAAVYPLPRSRLA